MITFRKADFSDHVAIADLHARSWKETYRGIFSDTFLDNDVEAERLEAWKNRLSVEDERRRTTLALNGDTIVGFSCLFLDEDPVFGSFLDNLHIAREFRGKGIGKLLLQNCAKDILQESLQANMYLWVYEQNRNARAAYDRMGATNYGIFDREVEGGTLASTCRYIWKDVSVFL